MKRKFFLIAATIFCSTLINISFAQSGQQTTPTPSPGATVTPTRVTDSMLSDRLAKDLYGRNSATQTQTIDWYQTNYGYTGNYQIGTASYISRYDQQGNYVETLRQSQWSNATVPAALINAYAQSPYKEQRITGYWSVIDPGKTGYYLEFTDTAGKTLGLWANSQGKFTSAPYSSTTAQPANIPKD